MCIFPLLFSLVTVFGRILHFFHFILGKEIYGIKSSKVQRLQYAFSSSHVSEVLQICSYCLKLSHELGGLHYKPTTYVCNIYYILKTV
jgi:hypothetical protein